MIVRDSISNMRLGLARSRSDRMEKSSKYWHILRINSASDRDGYQISIVSLAQAFFQQEFARDRYLVDVFHAVYRRDRRGRSSMELKIDFGS
jgi:hypothetical protein